MLIYNKVAQIQLLWCDDVIGVNTPLFLNGQTCLNMSSIDLSKTINYYYQQDSIQNAVTSAHVARFLPLLLIKCSFHLSH